jgi:hypothetical protein
VNAACPTALVAAAATLILVGGARPLGASPEDGAGPPGRFELAAGVLWTGRIAVGAQNANERSPQGAPFSLFRTATDLGAAAGAEARIGVALTPVVQLDASASYLHPELQTAIRGDVENAAAIVATERTTQFTLEGALVVHLSRWHLGRRAVPFLSGGAGYLRQVADSLVQTGSTYHAGAGVKWWPVSQGRGRLKGLGISAEVRMVARRSGMVLDGRAHVSPGCAAALFLRL